MTVGLVFVSHSEGLAGGLVQLAAQMAPDVTLAPAGGTDDGRVGTSFDRVTAAISDADAGDGVIVLCDLGSAVLTAETALEFLDDAARARVELVDAPFVEGGVAAAVAAQTGASLGDVARAARDAASVWSETADVAPDAAPDADVSATAEQQGGVADGPIGREVTLINRDGLHARPAAEFVKLATTYDAKVRVNGTDAKSLLGIMALGLVKGTTVRLEADGAQAREAIDGLAGLIESGFGEAT